MTKDTKSMLALGSIVCAAVLATVIGVKQITNVFAFVSPILMILVLVSTAVGIAKTNESINIMEGEFRKGKVSTNYDGKEPEVFKPATYNVLNVLYLSIVLLFASYGCFLTAFFWLIIWTAVNAVWLKQKELYRLYNRFTEKRSQQ